MRELRLVLLGLAAVIALLLGAGFLMRAFKGPQETAAVVTPAPAVAPETSAPPQPATAVPSAALAAARTALDRTIADTPDYTRFFDRLRLVFPGEYETIMGQLAATAGARGSVGTINPDNAMADAVAALRKAHGALAAKASDTALSQIFALQLKETQALAERDAHLCVAFLYGANGSGFLAFAADHRPLVADAAIAGLDAMNSGRMDQVHRDSPSDADFQMLDKALVDQGVSRPEIDALLDGKTANPPIADDEMCKAGQTYLQTLAGLPADVRARLYGLAVDLMAKS